MGLLWDEHLSWGLEAGSWKLEAKTFARRFAFGF